MNRRSDSIKPGCAPRPKPGPRAGAWLSQWLARWLSLWLSAAASMGWAASPAAPAPAGAALMGVRFGGDAAITRVVLDLDAPVAGAIVPGESRADRLVVALTSLRATPPTGGRGQGLVARWSLIDNPPGGPGARLSLDLAPGARAARRFLIPPAAEGRPWRYVIDIEDADPLGALASGLSGPSPVGSSFPATGAGTGPAPGPANATSLALAAPAASQPATPRAIAARPLQAREVGARALKVIVIDAGHGGHDPGARSLVRNEKDITLAAALALKARLTAMGRYRVVLTRDSDVFIPLEARVQIARRAGADLFISLHADSAGGDPTPHGASVYTLSDHGQTRVNNVLGPHEWFAHAGGGRSEPGVSQILLDLTQRSTRNRSSRFAGLLIERIGQRVDLLPRSHRDAGYFVLLAPDVPAVLLEMGFITNPGDELRLTDPAQRDALMAGVADAIDSYFAGDSRLSAG